MINDIYFNDIAVENELRALLISRFKDEDVSDLFDTEINLVSMDFDGQTEVDLPAVTLNVYQNNYLNKDDEQIQTYTTFTAELNIYTSGNEKVHKNRLLCNEIIRTLQANQRIGEYYNRGLKLEENTEADSVLSSAYRRVIRMSGLCDNKQKLIK